jgi:polyphosphate kinase 2 (PPK2 family)
MLSTTENPPMAKGKKKPSKAGQDGERMKRKAYEAEMRKLQVKLCHLQEWVKKKGLGSLLPLKAATRPAKAAQFAR